MENKLNLIDIRRDKDSNFTVIEREELERLKKFEEKVLTALNTAISISYFMITMITILDIIIILSLL